MTQTKSYTHLQATHATLIQSLQKSVLSFYKVDRVNFKRKTANELRLENGRTASNKMFMQCGGLVLN
jgi:hypothetical protein